MPSNETKIVKATPKKDDDGKKVGASKVQIKAVDLAIIEAQKKKKTTKKAATTTTKKTAEEKETVKKTKTAETKAKAPAGTAMPKAKAPVGTPMPKAKAVGTAMPKNAVPQKKATTPQTEEDIEKIEVAAAEEKPKRGRKKKEVVETPVEAVVETTETPVATEEVKPAEEPKAEEPVKEEPKKEVIDYVPNVGVKIISRAADEPKTPVQPKKKKKEEKKKPKEYVGKRGENKDADNAPRKKNFKTDAKGEKVVAFTSSQNGDNRGKKGKDKDRDKNKKREREFFEEMPTDLSRNIKKKHSKYKETKVEEVEVVSQEVEEAIATGGYVINVPITVAGFCEQVEISTSQAIMALMKMGIMANVNQNLDEETAVLLGMELGITVAVKKAEEIVVEEGIDLHEDRESELESRPPIITVMGHVDHGKTSILDAIRSTNVTAGEAGGITQHIGASEVMQNGQRIVFLDTPGHEAFTAMRARGAHITDIAVLVVAADDSVMPQTIESISHAKAAGVPIIVAMNKMDKPAANPDLVKKDLAEQGLLVEDWGGNVICVPCSAKTKQGIPQLLDMILLQAEMLELKANPNRLAQGTVIEARLDKTRGPVASVLIMNGTLQAGAAIVAGTAEGRVRVMTNAHGEVIKKAGPATAVEITGLTEVPEAGDEFYMVKDEKTAREITERRKMKIRQEVLAKNSSMSLEKLFSQLQEGEVKDLNIIIKADVQGSVGALEQSLEGLHNDNVKVKIIHTGVGTVTESDIMLAGTSNAVIIGFNVRPSSAVQAMADREHVEIRTYRVIYEIIDDIEAAMKGMLAPEFKEVVIGKIEVRDTFKVPNVGVIAGGYVLEGKVARGAKLRLVRDGIVIHEGEISSLRRFKDDVREVAAGYECGIGIDKYNDVKTGDIIEAFKMEEVKKD
mgnify:CR=1 FL=1